jgi:mono/diheme cytochrome c family protein
MSIAVTPAAWLGPLAQSLLAISLGISASSAVAADPAAISRGEYLFRAADCAGCHASPNDSSALSGGLGLDTPFGTFRAPNLTPDPRYGIGQWTVGDFKTALRHGTGREGEKLFPVFPYTSFTNMSDHDVEDLYAYLMSRPARADANLPHEVKFPFNWRALLVFWRALFFHEGPLAPDATHDDVWNRGNYLVHAVAHCEECHSPRNFLGAVKTSGHFSGNVGGPDGQNAPNISSDKETGIGTWSEADIARLLKTGMTPDSDQVGSGMKSVVRGTSRLTDADRNAIAVYLKSVPPVYVKPPPPKKAS